MERTLKIIWIQHLQPWIRTRPTITVCSRTHETNSFVFQLDYKMLLISRSRNPKMFPLNINIPTPAKHNIFDAGQNAVCLLDHPSSLRSLVQPPVHYQPQILFHWTPFQPLFPQPVVLHRFVVTQVQEPVLDLIKSHATGLSPSICLAQISLQCLATLEQIRALPQFSLKANSLRAHIYFVFYQQVAIQVSSCNSLGYKYTLYWKSWSKKRNTIISKRDTKE